MGDDLLLPLLVFADALGMVSIGQANTPSPRCPRSNLIFTASHVHSAAICYNHPAYSPWGSAVRVLFNHLNASRPAAFAGERCTVVAGTSFVAIQAILETLLDRAVLALILFIPS